MGRREGDGERGGERRGVKRRREEGRPGSGTLGWAAWDAWAGLAWAACAAWAGLPHEVVFGIENLEIIVFLHFWVSTCFVFPCF